MQGLGFAGTATQRASSRSWGRATGYGSELAGSSALHPSCFCQAKVTGENQKQSWG